MTYKAKTPLEKAIGEMVRSQGGPWLSEKQMKAAVEFLKKKGITKPGEDAYDDIARVAGKILAKHRKSESLTEGTKAKWVKNRDSYHGGAKAVGKLVVLYVDNPGGGNWRWSVEPRDSSRLGGQSLVMSGEAGSEAEAKAAAIKAAPKLAGRVKMLMRENLEEGMNLWGLSRATGQWKLLRDVTPETKDQWLKIWQGEADVRKKYSHLVVASKKPQSAVRGPGQSLRVPKSAIQLQEMWYPSLPRRKKKSMVFHKRISLPTNGGSRLWYNLRIVDRGKSWDVSWSDPQGSEYFSELVLKSDAKKRAWLKPAFDAAGVKMESVEITEEKLTPESLLAYMRRTGHEVEVESLAYSFGLRPQAVEKLLLKMVQDGKLVRELRHKKGGKRYTYMLPEGVELDDDCVIEEIDPAHAKAHAVTDQAGYVRIFDSLKPKQVVWMAYSSVVGTGSKNFRPYTVARRSHSKKYNVTSITLLHQGQKKGLSPGMQTKLMKRGGKVTVALGDLGASLLGLYVDRSRNEDIAPADDDPYITEAVKNNLVKMLPWADDPEFGGTNAI